MSGKEDLIPGLTSELPEKPTCSITKPNSLVQGCINEMKNAATNPGYALMGAGAAGGAAWLAKNNPIGSAAKAFGAEGISACGAGAINTAIDNCKATDPNKSNLSSSVVNKFPELTIPTTTPLVNSISESKMPPIPSLSAANEPPPSSLISPTVSSVTPPSAGTSLPSLPPSISSAPNGASIPSLDPIPSSTTDSSLMGVGMDSHSSL